MADLAAARTAHLLVLAGAVRRHVVVVEIALRGLGTNGVDPLDVRGRPQGGDGERLRLTTREEARTVSARHKPNFDRDRPDLVDAAAVHSNAFAQRQLADGLLVHDTEQALADARLAARRLEELLGLRAGRPIRVDGSRDAFLQRLHAVGEILREADDQLGGGLCIRQRPMALLKRDVEKAGEVRQRVLVEVRVGLAGNDERVEVATVLEAEAVADRSLEETQVETDVVAHDWRVTGELQELLAGLAGGGRLRNVAIRQPVDLVPDDRPARIHQG